MGQHCSTLIQQPVPVWPTLNLIRVHSQSKKWQKWVQCSKRSVHSQQMVGQHSVSSTCQSMSGHIAKQAGDRHAVGGRDRCAPRRRGPAVPGRHSTAGCTTLNAESATIGRLLADYWPTIGRLLADYGPTIDRLLPDYCPIIARLLPDCWPAAARLLADGGPGLD